ncbi:unnamed protein product [Rhizoctonia solani]|uniref:Uncharacterized protein n=3 Tax=Rhizoctonia solani TaxID=456999 RepID=A0A8H2WG45_9AGAM
MSMSSSGSSTIHPLSNPYPQSYRSSSKHSSSSQPGRRVSQTTSGSSKRQRTAPPVRRTTPPSTPRYAPPSAPPTPLPIVPPPDEKKRSPVSPAVLRSIFASARTANEERSISRIAFFRFVGFILSCLGISVYAARGRGIRAATGLGLSML